MSTTTGEPAVEPDVLDDGAEDSGGPEAIDPTRLQVTFVPSDGVPAAGAFALWGTHDLVATAASFGLPAGEHDPVRLVVPGDDGALGEQEVEARLVPVLPMVRVLAAMPTRDSWPAWRRPSDALASWSLASKLALEFVAEGHLLPYVRPGVRAGTAVGLWRAAPGADPRGDALAEAMPAAAHCLARRDGDPWEGRELLMAFLDAVADVCGRGGRRPGTDGRGRTPRRPWVESWVEALSGPDPVVGNLPFRPTDVAADVAEWAAPALERRTSSRARLAIRLHTPETAASTGGTDGAADGPAGVRDWRVDLQLQAVLDPRLLVEAAAVWDEPSGVVELDEDTRIEDAHEVLAAGIGTAADVYAPLRRALEQPRPDRLPVDVDEAAELLSVSEELGDAGIAIHLPPELDALGTGRLRLRLVVGEERSEYDEPLERGRVEAEPLGARRLSDFRYEIALGDDRLTLEEFREIVGVKRPVVRWRDQWIRLDAAEVAKIEKLAEKEGELSFADALAAALGGFWDDGDGAVEVVAKGEVEAFVHRLRNAERPGEPLIQGITADLRPYQERGIAWLQAMDNLGLGAVLADQMGLGKTLQGIGLMTGRSRRKPHLVVCPTSVVGNWEREINRFAPDVPVVRHHGPERIEDPREFLGGQIVVTTYAILRRDVEVLSGVDWDVVIFDEAQQIKNTASKGAKAARELRAGMRVAMTGTPVENRLAELWAILDVVNPGLLGTQRRFTRQFAVPIERWRDEEAAHRLRRLVAPFVLRRRKDDADVALSLPPKTELTVTCTLSREQATLYQAAVDDTFGPGGSQLGEGGIGRKGRILRLLTALKQICNHPAHYLGEDGPIPGRSGKLARATEILAEVVDSGERALVFTQFRKMGDLLQRHFAEALELPEVPFLHGGVPLAARDDMVRRFQEDEDAPPILLVSLRAGGTGLNLTRATQVVHFDRWWNPAVEDQATDRVHRIGQTKAVTVHRLVTAGTIEERIAALLESKRDLAESVVGSGEAWLTELGDDELLSLVQLNADDIDDEEAA